MKEQHTIHVSVIRYRDKGRATQHAPLTLRPATMPPLSHPAALRHRGNTSWPKHTSPSQFAET